MDAKDLKEAGNALVGWCNSQQLKPKQSLTVMRKVIAQIILRSLDEGVSEREIEKEVNGFAIDLVHDILDVLRARR